MNGDSWCTDADLTKVGSGRPRVRTGAALLATVALVVIGAATSVASGSPRPGWSDSPAIGTGFLRVVTAPAVPSQITVDGMIADSWGLEWVKQPAGPHTVCFTSVRGYTTPACETVLVNVGETTTLVGTFVERGYLQVTTSPAVNSQISVDGVQRNNWGMWTDLEVGSHEVCFGPVAGFTPPGCQTVNVTAGGTTTITGTFPPSSAVGTTGLGALRVTTSPPVPSQILVDGAIANTWGLDWVQTTPGPHEVCFTHVEGYTEPECSTVDVTDGATTTLTGTFTQRGFLKIDTSPAVAGTISIGGVPVDDWGDYTDRPVGSYHVCFGAVAGYRAPECQDTVVTGGNLTAITGLYTGLTRITSGDGSTDWASISGDGEYVAFRSFASNLVDGDTNDQGDAFIWQRSTGSTTRITNGNDTTYQAKISSDGSYVAYDSYASNLVAGDTNGQSDVFVWNRTTGATTRITNGNANSILADISGDGRYVVFQSFATNLEPGSNGNGNVFLWDRTTGVTTRVTNGDQISGAPTVSTDGSTVAYFSYASDLVPNDTNGKGDVFVWNRAGGATTRISTGGFGFFGVIWAPVISADGRYVAYSIATDDAGYSSRYDIYTWDRNTATTTQVTAGDASSGFFGELAISGDGRFVAFSSSATDLVPDDTNHSGDVFMWDRNNTTIRRAVDDAQLADLSADGDHLAVFRLSPSTPWDLYAIPSGN